MTTWRRLLVTLLLVGVAVTAAPLGVGAQEPAPPAPPPGSVVQSWALFPTGSPDPDQPGNRPNLTYTVPAGSTFDDSVTVANYGSVPLTLRIYASDAFNNAEGGFDLLAGSETPVDVGSWITPVQEFVTVPPGQQYVLPITIAVPLDASPGDHVGAVVASLQTPGTGPDGKTVTLDQRTGTRVYLRVDGPLNPDLSVENLRTNYSPSINPLSGTAEVSYRIQNRGNVRLSGTQQLEIGGPFGLFSTTESPQEIPELLPGQGYDVTRTVEGVTATGASITRVTLNAESEGGGVEVPSSSGQSISLALPVLLIALLVVLALVWYARRAYKRRAEGQQPPSGGPGRDMTPRSPAPPAPVGQSS